MYKLFLKSLKLLAKVSNIFKIPSLLAAALNLPFFPQEILPVRS